MQTSAFLRPLPPLVGKRLQLGTPSPPKNCGHPLLTAPYIIFLKKNTLSYHSSTKNIINPLCLATHRALNCKAKIFCLLCLRSLKKCLIKDYNSILSCLLESHNFHQSYRKVGSTTKGEI